MLGSDLHANFRFVILVVVVADVAERGFDGALKVPQMTAGNLKAVLGELSGENVCERKG